MIKFKPAFIGSATTLLITSYMMPIPMRCYIFMGLLAVLATIEAIEKNK